MSDRQKSAAAIAAEVRSKKRSAVETTREALDRVQEIDVRLGAFLETDRERALKEAAEVDRRLAAGETLALAGVPVALKDNLCAVGYRCTCGSRFLENYRPPYDATAVARLKAAGAVILGKTNLDEFAMGSSTENSAFGPVRNPWALDYAPGGSSGGSAVAVAAGMAPLSLGSDTGGSIRQPASFTGVVGLKPTYGRVSRFGLVAFASSLDQIGPFARSIEDAALTLRVLAGPDQADATCSGPVYDDASDPLDGGVQGLKIGLPKEYFQDGVDDDVRAAVENAAETLKGRGATLVKVGLPHTPYAIPAYYVIATAEASSNLARFDGVRYGRRAPNPSDLAELYANSRHEGFGPEVRRRILLGTFCLSSGYYDAYYEKALRARALIAADFDAAFKSCDVVLGPAAPTPAFKLGEKSSDPLQMYQSDVLTGACNLAGLPGLVLPCGFATRDGARLPIGAQFIGPRGFEARLFRVARALERATGLEGLVATTSGAKR